MIGNLASDANNPQFQGPSDPDAVMHVVFYIRANQDNFESAKQQKPVFRDELYVRIAAPGNNLNVIDRPAEEQDKRRFPRQWEIYKNTQGQGEQVVGMPIAEWTYLSKSRVEELRGRRFFTVEQLAGASDLQTQAMGMDGMSLRQKARDFLSVAKNLAAAEEKVKENEDLKNKMKEQEERHQREMQEMRDLIQKAVQSVQPQPAVQTEKPKRKYTRRKPVEAPPG